MSRLFVTCCALSLLMSTACTSEFEAPERPDSVPAAAVWVGGVDGGAWIHLEKRSGDPSGIYRAEIYDDQTGGPWYLGRLAVESGVAPDPPFDDPARIGIWDGDSLIMSDGTVLSAIDEYDPFDPGNRE